MATTTGTAHRAIEIARALSTVIHEPDPATVGGRAAVIAVLRALADSYPNEPITNATPEVAAELYVLANEVEGVSL